MSSKDLLTVSPVNRSSFYAQAQIKSPSKEGHIGHISSFDKILYFHVCIPKKGNRFL